MHSGRNRSAVLTKRCFPASLNGDLTDIRQCDRILVLDKGNVIEDGTYDELIEKGRFFAELVKRQRLDTAG